MKPVKSLTFGGILTALFVIASILLRYEIPGIEIVILFFVPFFAAFYSYKNKLIDCGVFFAATMLITMLIDWSSALLYILPSITVGLLYGFLIKAKFNGYTIVYTLTIAEFGLTMLGSCVIKLITGNSLIDIFQTLFSSELEYNSRFLGLGILIFYSFVQAFFIHIVMRRELKKLKVDVPSKGQPPIWLLLVSLISIVLSFFKFEEDIYSFFTAVSAIVFGLPIVLYGYQESNKPWILLAVQLGFFLVGTLPLMLEATGYEVVSAYIILFIPPLGFAFYQFLKDDKKEAK